MADEAPKTVKVNVTNLSPGVRYVQTAEGSLHLGPEETAEDVEMFEGDILAAERRTIAGSKDAPEFKITKAGKSRTASASGGNGGGSGEPKPLREQSVTALRKLAKDEEIALVDEDNTPDLIAAKIEAGRAAKANPAQ